MVPVEGKPIPNLNKCLNVYENVSQIKSKLNNKLSRKVHVHTSLHTTGISELNICLGPLWPPEGPWESLKCFVLPLFVMWLLSSVSTQKHGNMLRGWLILHLINSSYLCQTWCHIHRHSKYLLLNIKVQINTRRVSWVFYLFKNRKHRIIKTRQADINNTATTHKMDNRCVRLY